MMDKQGTVEELQPESPKEIFLLQVAAALGRLGVPIKVFSQRDTLRGNSLEDSLISPHSLKIILFDKKRFTTEIEFAVDPNDFYQQLVKKICDQVNRLIPRYPDSQSLSDPDRVAKRMVATIMIFEKIRRELVIPWIMDSADGINEEDFSKIVVETIAKFQ